MALAPHVSRSAAGKRMAWRADYRRCARWSRRAGHGQDRIRFGRRSHYALPLCEPETGEVMVGVGGWGLWGLG